MALKGERLRFELPTWLGGKKKTNEMALPVENVERGEVTFEGHQTQRSLDNNKVHFQTENDFDQDDNKLLILAGSSAFAVLTVALVTAATGGGGLLAYTAIAYGPTLTVKVVGAIAGAAFTWVISDVVINEFGGSFGVAIRSFKQLFKKRA